MAIGLFLLAGCGKGGPKNIDVIIESTGKHKVNGRYVSFLEVKENKDGKLRLSFGSSNLPTVSSPGLDLHTGWFVYGESETRFWVFDGASELKLFEYSGVPGDEKLSGLKHSPEEIPVKLLPKLPATMKSE